MIQHTAPFTSKALVAIATLAGGAAAVGVLLHLQTDRFAFTSTPATHAVETPVADATVASVVVEPDVALPQDVVRPVEPRARRARVTPKHALRPRVAAPCEPSWHELESGPVGRRVLITCPGNARAAAPTVHPTSHAVRTRSRATGTRRDRPEPQ